MSKNSSLKTTAHGNKSKRIIEFYDESKDNNPRLETHESKSKVVELPKIVPSREKAET